MDKTDIIIFLVTAVVFLAIGFFLGADIERSSMEKALNIEHVKKLDK
jgi:uncharacterized protein YneF (UPF0154 family)